MKDAVKTATRPSRYNYGRVLVPVDTRNNYRSIADLEDDRIRREQFDMGCKGAAALMCLMFLVLTLGAVFLGW